VDIESRRMGTAADGWPSLALVPDSKVCARARRLVQDRQLKLAKISNQKNHQSTIINLIVSERVREE
jgi:hypothetical protein